MGSKQVLPLQVRVDMGLMTIKGYSTFPRSQDLEPHHQMLFNIILRTILFWESMSYPSGRGYNQHILSLANWADINLTHRWHAISYYHFRSEWAWE